MRIKPCKICGGSVEVFEVYDEIICFYHICPSGSQVWVDPLIHASEEQNMIKKWNECNNLQDYKGLPQ